MHVAIHSYNDGKNGTQFTNVTKNAHVVYGPIMKLAAPYAEFGDLVCDTREPCQDSAFLVPVNVNCKQYLLLQITRVASNSQLYGL